MAERVDKVPRQKGGGIPKYPWDEWLDGSLWELIQGKDFDCLPESMYSPARSAGQRMGIQVSIQVRGDRVYVQAQR